MLGFGKSLLRQLPSCNIVYDSSKSSPPYELLAKAVEATNCSKVTKLAENPKGIFEHAEIVSEKKKDPRLHVSLSSWLAGWNTFCTGAWMGELKHPRTMLEEAQKITAIAATKYVLMN